MENLLTTTDRKLEIIIRHCSMGLVEIDGNGNIAFLNPRGVSLLKPIWIAHDIDETNFFPLLTHIAPGILKLIHESAGKTGNLVSDEVHTFSLSFGGESIQRHFSFTVTRIFGDCFIIGFDDVTGKRQNEAALQQFLIDGAVTKEKFEIASNILHDIGNALVGFGSYINRIKRSIEQNQSGNIEKMGDFFSSRHEELDAAFGKAKADAVNQLFGSIIKAQKINNEEIQHSISEQLNIITHIQEILTIQRQYAGGQDFKEAQQLNLRTIINDCMSMLLASIEKRGIKVTVDAAEKLPVIMGDKTRLMQAILNIVKNSVEAIDITAAEKTILVSVTVCPNSLELRIKDNGHGFDQLTASKLFERGFTTKASGSGIGLSSCRAIIEGHNAVMKISSDGFGKGAETTITFSL